MGSLQVVWGAMGVVVVLALSGCSANNQAPADDQTGTVVTCNDGTTSQAGGRQGACSHHGGESGGTLR